MEATRWPERLTVADDSQGVPLALMLELARHWVSGYDWSRCEGRLNALPNFITEIDGRGHHDARDLGAQGDSCASKAATTRLGALSRQESVMSSRSSSTSTAA